MRYLLSTIAAIVICASCASAQEHAAAEQLYTPADIKWQAGPPSLPTGASFAMLEGDLSKEGPFVVRLKMPDGYKIAAHTHPKVEHITVVSGAFHIVMGDNLDPKNARKLPAGSFGYWPAGMKHLVWTEGETVVQLHGTGPWSIDYVNPADDPRKQAK